MEEIIIKKGLENMDIPAATKLIQSTYWADDRTDETILTSMKNSICYGAFEVNSGKQIGFARVITDYSTTFYLCDVIIEEQYRGKKVGTLLVGTITEDNAIKNLRGILGTRDAFTFYEKFGFIKKDIFMQRWAKVFK